MTVIPIRVQGIFILFGGIAMTGRGRMKDMVDIVAFRVYFSMLNAVHLH